MHALPFSADGGCVTLAAKAPKPKRCKVCPERFTPRNSMQVVCSPLCGSTLARRTRERKEAELAREDRKDTRERKELLKTRADYTREAQQAFNEFIRWRDRAAGHACVSSGRPLDWSGNAVDAGHYRSVGSAPHLRFDERNCHAQTKHENRFLSGNAVDYRVGLIARIGLEAVEALEADQEPRRYTVDDLQKIKAEYRAKVRALKREVASIQRGGA